MLKLFFILTILFSVLCFIGAGYVLYNKGQVNAGYAVIPMLCTICCLLGYRFFKKKDESGE